MDSKYKFFMIFYAKAVFDTIDDVESVTMCYFWILKIQELYLDSNNTIAAFTAQLSSFCWLQLHKLVKNCHSTSNINAQKGWDIFCL